jgi:lactoylglutathione lyase
MKFAYTIIYVPDVAAALDFYERAFGFTRRFFHESGSYGELETGGTALAFASEEQGKSNGVSFRANRLNETSAGIELAFVTEKVEEAFIRAVKAGAEATKKAEKKPWGQVVAYVRDLNGVLIELCTPVEG